MNQSYITNPSINQVFLRRLIIVLLLLCTLSSKLFAQYDTLLHKPYNKKVLGVHAMYKDLIDIGDSVKRDQKAGEIKAFARKNNDKGLELEVYFFEVFWNAFYQQQPKEVAHTELKKLVALVSKEDYCFLKARALRAMAEFYWKIEKNYELAFEQYLLLDKELQNAKPEDYPEMARDLMQIGEAYYYFHDYAIAINYFKRAIAIPENSFNTMVINTAKNDLGLCYQQENKLDSADYYFQEIQKTQFPESQVWKRIATGNLGGNMYLRKEYDKAIPLLAIDLNGSLKENDYGCAAGAAISLADIYREKGNLQDSKNYIALALDNIKKAGQADRLRLLYPVISKWYAAMGDGEKSKRYVDSSVLALKKYNDKFSALKLLRAQQKVDRQKEQIQLATFNLEKQKKITERNLLLLLVFILGIVTLLTYFIQKKRQLAKDIKLQAAKQELEIAHINLNRFTKSILEKNELIEQLQSKNPEEDKTEIFQQLQQSTILTEDDWQAFQQLFDKAYPGFIQRVKEKYTELSIGELRYFVLSRLNLSTKEMAAMLGVSSNAIQVMRHRIRKKLSLEDTNALDEMIKTV